MARKVEALEAQQAKVADSEYKRHGKLLEKRQRTLDKLQDEVQAVQAKQAQLHEQVEALGEPKERRDRDFRKQTIMTFRTLWLENALLAFIAALLGPLSLTISSSCLLTLLFERSGTRVETAWQVIYEVNGAGKVVKETPVPGSIGGSKQGSEGQSITLTADGWTDPDAGQTLTYTWTVQEVGSGAWTMTYSGPSISVTFPDDGEYEVTLTARDDGPDGGLATTISDEVAIENVALLRNNELTTAEPATFDELRAEGHRIMEERGIEYPFTVSQSPETGDPYHLSATAKRFIPSHFRHPEREPETEVFARWFDDSGWEVTRLPESVVQAELEWRKQSTTEQLQRAGLYAGQVVIVHMSMKAFGRYIIGGEQAVIDALMAVITAQGTLVMPTHSADKE